MHRVLLFAVTLSLSVGCGGGLTTNAGKPSADKPIEVAADKPIEIAADKLLAEYRVDAKASDEKYKDKTLTVTGSPSTIYAAGRNYPGNILYFDDKDKKSIPTNIECFFSISKADDLSSLQRGHPAIIRGTCRGVEGVNLKLLDCDVIRRRR
jgi:hypothetical protein